MAQVVPQRRRYSTCSPLGGSGNVRHNHAKNAAPRLPEPKVQRLDPLADVGCRHSRYRTRNLDVPLAGKPPLTSRNGSTHTGRVGARHAVLPRPVGQHLPRFHRACWVDRSRHRRSRWNIGGAWVCRTGVAMGVLSIGCIWMREQGRTSALMVPSICNPGHANAPFTTTPRRQCQGTYWPRVGAHPADRRYKQPPTPRMLR